VPAGCRARSQIEEEPEQGAKQIGQGKVGAGFKEMFMVGQRMLAKRREWGHDE
jgi:hypothetical protein